MNRYFLAFLSLLLIASANCAVAADFVKAMNAYNKGDFLGALTELTPLAEQGDVEAQYGLGVMYNEGQGVQKNIKLAIKWFEKSARQGNPYAQYNLGVIFRDSERHRDYGVSFRWFEKSASQGLDVAQYNFAHMFQEGLGTNKNYQSAIDWFKKAAEQGYADAQYYLGSLYLQGQLVPKDYSIASGWLNKAASQGVHRAQNDIGTMFQHGLGTDVNYPAAVKWYTLAAQKGLLEAQVNLAAMHAKGLGVERNTDAAVKLWHLAAEQGYEPARKALKFIEEHETTIKIQPESLGSWFYALMSVLAINVVVYVHALGHLIGARLFGISVKTISIGLGPRLTDFSKGGTLWKICWLPVGGYVKTNIENDDAGTVWGKIGVAASGALSNALYFFVVISLLFLFAGPPIAYTYGLAVGQLSYLDTLIKPFFEMLDILSGKRIISSSSLLHSYGGVVGFIGITAVWSLKFGILILLPIPKFDGWKIFEIILAFIAGGNLGKKIMKWGASLALIFFLGYATWNDLLHLFGFK